MPSPSGCYFITRSKTRTGGGPPPPPPSAFISGGGGEAGGGGRAGRGGGGGPALAWRVRSRGEGGQILLPGSGFDAARQLGGEPPPVSHDGVTTAPALRWMAHGLYRFKGADSAME